jgi:hypothetical protein
VAQHAAALFLPDEAPHRRLRAGRSARCGTEPAGEVGKRAHDAWAIPHADGDAAKTFSVWAPYAHAAMPRRVGAGNRDRAVIDRGRLVVN